MPLARLDVIILSLLTANDRTGYDIHKWLERNGTAVGYNTQPSQIYRQLTRMESVGWAVSSVEERDRGPDAKVFRITEAGTAKLESWIDSPYVPAPRPLDSDFQVRLMFSSPRGPAKMLELVRTELAYRREHEEYRKDLDVDLVPRDATPQLRAWFKESALVQSERGHYMVQTLIAWLESAEVRLKNLVDSQ
ncbi:PadR family transcriptional regulator [Microbacterium deminutum]|uniref:Transcription regulator PadR N-terminal domain-containing protein n=1 Tax=Microbacterium deminutum TaxID=344164 RepID=A0ABN2R4T8_9MICO